MIADPSVLQFDLPDPDRDDMSLIEFLDRLEKAWAVCDRVDLQTDIWRGKILRAVRNREKRGGQVGGTGFLQWLREREISKTRAYSLIQLAEAADDLISGGVLEESNVNNFSRRAFIETAHALPEVRQMISEAANEGQSITRRQVRRLNDEFTAVTSTLLPEEIRERTQANLLPTRVVAPLVKELSKLPEVQLEDLQNALREEPEVECVKDVTNSARWIGKSIDASLSLRVLQVDNLNIEKAIQEAQRIDAMSLLSDAFVPTFFIAFNPHEICLVPLTPNRENFVKLVLISGGLTTISLSLASCTNLLIASESCILKFIEVVRNSSKKLAFK